MFCLRQPEIDKLKDAFRKGELDPEKLNIESQARRELLSKYISPENAKQVSLLFEKKLLLKNQEKAMYDFANETLGMNQEAKQEITDKIKKSYQEKKDRVFDPKEDEKFLNEITSEIYSKKYSTEVSLEDAQKITELAHDVKEARDSIKDESVKTKESENFGAAKVALDNYVGELKNDIVKEGLVNPLKQDSVVEGAKAVINNAKISINFIAENSRSIIAALDNSFWFRQGFKALVNPIHTKAWTDNFIQSWKDIGKTIAGGDKTGDAILDGVKAEIYSRPNYLNGRYELGKKLDVGTGEEQYPSSLPSKIPVLGRLFRASEVAYEAGAMRLRADIADKLYEVAEKAGIDLKDPKQVGDINEVVNSMTGRGRLSLDQKTAKAVNSAFFSIKFVKSNIDTLTLHQGKLSKFATTQAAINLTSAVVSAGVVLSIAKALYPDSTDFDPKGNLFGKIKIGNNVPIDITGGMGAFVILASRIISQESKNSKTGVTTKLGSGYGVPTTGDVLINFTEGKFSPFFGVLRDYVLRQKDMQGNKPTVGSEALGLITPIEVSNWVQSKKESAGVRLATMILDGVGFNANSGNYEKNWGSETTKELEQFLDKVGKDKFLEANEEYNNRYNDWLDKAVDTSEYRNLSDEDKKRLLMEEKSKLKKTIFKEYGFHYKEEHLSKLPKIK